MILPVPVNRVVLPALAVLAVWVGVIWLWEPAAWALLFDDSFYYFAIARNLVHGYGSTFDRIHPTNGYHPLWLLMCAPVCLVADGMTAPRLLLTAQLAMFGAMLVVIARRHVASANGPVGPILALIAANPYLVKTWVNGLETMVYSLILAVMLDAWEPATRQRRVALSVLLGLAFLARTDAGLLLPILALWFARERKFVEAVEVLLLPTLVVLGYLAFNQAMFGHAMQVSGELKRVPLTAMRSVVVAVCLGAPFLLMAVLRRTQFHTARAFVDRTAFFLVFVAVLVGYYCGVQTFPRLWYFGPVALYLVMVMSYVAEDLVALAVTEAPGRPPSQSARPVLAILALPLAVAILLLGPKVLGSTTAMQADRNAGVWIGRNLPPDAILASWDAGVLGYFASQSVVNLDGVVNSPEYLTALRTGTTAAFLRESGVQYVCNHDDLWTGEASMAEDAGGLLGRERVRRWTLLKTWPFVFEGGTNGGGSGTHEMAVFLFGLPEKG